MARARSSGRSHSDQPGQLSSVLELQRERQGSPSFKTSGFAGIGAVSRRDESSDRREDSAINRWRGGPSGELEESEPDGSTNTRRDISRRADQDSLFKLAQSRIPLRRRSPPLLA